MLGSIAVPSSSIFRRAFIASYEAEIFLLRARSSPFRHHLLDLRDSVVDADIDHDLSDFFRRRMRIPGEAIIHTRSGIRGPLTTLATSRLICGQACEPRVSRGFPLFRSLSSRIKRNGLVN